MHIKHKEMHREGHAEKRSSCVSLILALTQQTENMRGSYMSIFKNTAKEEVDC